MGHRDGDAVILAVEWGPTI